MTFFVFYRSQQFTTVTNAVFSSCLQKTKLSIKSITTGLSENLVNWRDSSLGQKWNIYLFVWKQVQWVQQCILWMFYVISRWPSGHMLGLRSHQVRHLQNHPLTFRKIVLAVHKLVVVTSNPQNMDLGRNRSARCLTACPGSKSRGKLTLRFNRYVGLFQLEIRSLNYVLLVFLSPGHCWANISVWSAILTSQTLQITTLLMFTAHSASIALAVLVLMQTTWSSEWNWRF